MSNADPTTTTDPLDMRSAMADYVRTVHQAYLSASAGQPPGIRGRLALLDQPFTVVAAGVRNLRVIATTQRLSPPTRQEVALDDELPGMQWTLRFFDPVVLPQLGFVDETAQPASQAVRQALGITTHTYHLVVQPGGSLTTHHAGHAGAGLAIYDLLAATSAGYDLTEAVLPPMTMLRSRTGETVQVAVLAGREVVHVERLESPPQSAPTPTTPGGGPTRHQ